MRPSYLYRKPFFGEGGGGTLNNLFTEKGLQHILLRNFYCYSLCLNKTSYIFNCFSVCFYKLYYFYPTREKKRKKEPKTIVFNGVRYFPKVIFPRATSQVTISKWQFPKRQLLKGYVRPSEAPHDFVTPRVPIGSLKNFSQFGPAVKPAIAGQTIFI